MDDPSVQPDATCIAQMGSPAFVEATEIKLVGFENDELGIKGVVPKGWIELEQGVYAPSLLADVSIIQIAVAGVAPAELLAGLLAGLGVGEIPESAGTLSSEMFTWTLYELEALSLAVDVAIAEDDAGTSYMVMMTSGPTSLK